MLHVSGLDTSVTTTFSKGNAMTAQYRPATVGHHDPDLNCPFFAAEQHACRAAIIAYVPDSLHIYHYCQSDDHDSCAMFLAKALRSSSPGGLARDTAALSGK
jgi:hypothetical protein